MKKMVIAMIAAVMMSSAAFAQDNQEKKCCECKRPDKTEMIKHRTDRVVEKYKLDDKQAAQLLELNTKYADKIGGPRGRHGHHGRHHGMKPGEKPDANTGATPQREKNREEFEKMRKEREANRKAYDAELQKIVNADQYKEYQADMKKHGGRGPRHHHKDKK